MHTQTYRVGLAADHDESSLDSSSGSNTGSNRRHHAAGNHHHSAAAAAAAAAAAQVSNADDALQDNFADLGDPTVTYLDAEGRKITEEEARGGTSSRGSSSGRDRDGGGGSGMDDDAVGGAVPLFGDSDGSAVIAPIAASTPARKHVDTATATDPVPAAAASVRFETPRRDADREREIGPDPYFHLLHERIADIHLRARALDRAGSEAASLQPQYQHQQLSQQQPTSAMSTATAIPLATDSPSADSSSGSSSTAWPAVDEREVGGGQFPAAASSDPFGGNGGFDAFANDPFVSMPATGSDSNKNVVDDDDDDPFAALASAAVAKTAAEQPKTGVEQSRTAAEQQPKTTGASTRVKIVSPTRTKTDTATRTGYRGRGTGGAGNNTGTGTTGTGTVTGNGTSTRAGPRAKAETELAAMNRLISRLDSMVDRIKIAEM
jgi:hypothetical protein